jgi:hypothetical protein
MLAPLDWNRQPFRFVNLFADDNSRLHAAVHASLEQSRRQEKHNLRDHEQVERLRAW